VDGRALNELRALEARDGELGDRAERLRETDDAIAAARARAEEIAAFFAAYDAETERCRAEIAAAETGVRQRQADVAAAEQEAAAAGDAESRGHAERAITRASDHLSVAVLRLDRARADLEHNEHTASELEQALPLLAARARSISLDVDLPQPGGDPLEVVDWASRAHAELFVAAAQLSAQRERLVREGNELASMLLGEPTYGLTVAQALRHVEAGSGRDRSALIDT
jgi:hypothetical protein